MVHSGFGLQALRHTHEAQLLMAGIALQVVSERLDDAALRLDPELLGPSAGVNSKTNLPPAASPSSGRGCAGAYGRQCKGRRRG